LHFLPAIIIRHRAWFTQPQDQKKKRKNRKKKENIFGGKDYGKGQFLLKDP